jgi:alpha-L-fucosidase
MINPGGSNKTYFAIRAMVLVLAIISNILLSYSQDKEEKDNIDPFRDLNSSQSDSKKLFTDGNYAMFIHWGLYSQIADEGKGKTYYGISEWIMNRAEIPVDEYMNEAKNFNPSNFDAKAIVKLAKDAGMKYIIITGKHHDGFAMFHSKANKFNIVDATPYGRDPMKELSRACNEAGLGFGFYYSQNQDWTAPGGMRGPSVYPSGQAATFDEYFRAKCVPQVEEILTGYGPIQLIWFDTPDGMDKKYSKQLVDLVHEKQPRTLVSGRVGNGMGDYTTFGDMEVPKENIPGLWESVDVTNDSWGYSAYDQNWKSSKEILMNLISTVARGGTYMMNIGPKGDGSIPQQAERTLRGAGEWIRRYPQLVYGADASPWKHILPWGDVTVRGNKLYCAVYHWPAGGHLFLPGLETEISSVGLLRGTETKPLTYRKSNDWIDLSVPAQAPEKWISVIEITLKNNAAVNTTFGIDPLMVTSIPVNFASAEGCEKKKKDWMEKFGEWKHVVQIDQWKDNSKATWEVNVQSPGDYLVELTYSGKGRLVWSVETDEHAKIKNQQNSSEIYNTLPIGWIRFEKPGKHTVSVSLLEGIKESASLTAINFKPVEN